MMKILQNRRGFTLLELLISISILAVGLLAVVSMQVVALQSNSLAYRNSAATSVAQQVMDDLLSVDIQPNNFWWSRFYGAPANPYANGGLGSAAVTTPRTFAYDRFPPFDGQTNTTPRTTYIVPASGTYTAQYTIRPNTPTTNVAQIEVVVSVNGTQMPFSFYNYRSVPSL